MGASTPADADDSFDVDAYLARIGLADADISPARLSLGQLTAIHRAHVQSIPFENLDPHRGRAPSLRCADLQRKLVHERRGGYCFEQNTLLAAALRALGVEAEVLLARVRWRAPPGVVRGRTHLVVRASLDGREWLLDVGFGPQTPTEPIPFGPGGPYEQGGWRFRTRAEPPLLVLEAPDAGGWEDLYAIETTAPPSVDIEMGNWFTGAHPDSTFVTGLMVSRVTRDGERLLILGWPEPHLHRGRPDGGESEPVAPEAVPELLRRHFGLDGWALGANGRIVGAPDIGI